MLATRYAVAIHLLLLLATAGGRAPVTSVALAGCLRTNPVVVRRISGQLARAGLLTIRRGPGGASLARPPASITLDAIWAAVHAGKVRPLLPLHLAADEPARRVHAVLAGAFADAEAAFHRALGRVTLADLAGRLRRAA